MKFTQCAAANPWLSFFGGASCSSGFGFLVSSARLLACLAASHSETLASVQWRVTLAYSCQPASATGVSDVRRDRAAPSGAGRGVPIWGGKATSDADVTMSSQ